MSPSPLSCPGATSGWTSNGKDSVPLRRIPGHLLSLEKWASLTYGQSQSGQFPLFSAFDTQSLCILKFQGTSVSHIISVIGLTWHDRSTIYSPTSWVIVRSGGLPKQSPPPSHFCLSKLFTECFEAGDGSAKPTTLSSQAAVPHVRKWVPSPPTSVVQPFTVC